MIEVCVSRKLIFGAAALVAAATGSVPAFAHHSGAMFDNTKTITLTGAVKEYKWLNPHGSIEMITLEPGGVEKVWAIEMSTPNILVRKGWSAHSLKPGDKVTVTARPMRDGGPAGMVLAVTTPTGAVLKDHDY